MSASQNQARRTGWNTPGPPFSPALWFLWTYIVLFTYLRALSLILLMVSACGRKATLNLRVGFVTVIEKQLGDASRPGALVDWSPAKHAFHHDSLRPFFINVRAC